MKRIAVFPGSFDPITIGHVQLVLRALPLFDEIIVAVGVNSTKPALIPLDLRLEMLRLTFAKHQQIQIDSYEKLTVDYCRRRGASFLIRGLRNASDFDYEKTISQINNVLGDGLETVFLIAKPGMSHVSSTIVREIFKGGGDVSPFVPQEIEGLLKSLTKQNNV